jgi:hypothetical protein
MTFGYLAVLHILNNATAAGLPQSAASLATSSSAGVR